MGDHAPGRGAAVEPGPVARAGGARGALGEAVPDGSEQQLNTEMMELYKREKVNPMAGCLPVVIQIPKLPMRPFKKSRTQKIGRVKK